RLLSERALDDDAALKGIHVVAGMESRNGGEEGDAGAGIETGEALRKLVGHEPAQDGGAVVEGVEIGGTGRVGRADPRRRSDALAAGVLDGDVPQAEDALLPLDVDLAAEEVIEVAGGV